MGERTDDVSLTGVEGPSDEYETYIPILVVYVVDIDDSSTSFFFLVTSRTLNGFG